MPSAHAGHHDITEQEVHRFFMTLQQAQRLLAGGRPEHGIAGAVGRMAAAVTVGEALLSGLPSARRRWTDRAVLSAQCSARFAGGPLLA